MALNKSTGNMYAFVSHTYNPMNVNTPVLIVL